MRSERQRLGLIVLAACLGVGGVGASAETTAALGVRVIVFGDSGTGSPAQKALARQMRRFEDDLEHVFMLGDNVYFTGQAKRMRAAFHDVYARVLSLRRPDGSPQVRFHAALGNHDVMRCDVAGTADGLLRPDREAYDWRAEGCDVDQQLADPAFGYAHGRRYYDVALRDAEGRLLATVYVLDSNTLPSKRRPGPGDAAQLEWLEQRLDVTRAAALPGAEPWRIVTLHTPLRTPQGKGYIFGRGGHAEDGFLLTALHERLLGADDDTLPDPALEAGVAPLLARGSVDAVFGGHNHFYARLLPEADGIRHFVAGGGGIVTYEPDRSSASLAAAGGFNHFVTAVLTPGRFEYCVIDSLGRVRDHGYWERGREHEPDRPLEDPRYDDVCGR